MKKALQTIQNWKIPPRDCFEVLVQSSKSLKKYNTKNIDRTKWVVELRPKFTATILQIPLPAVNAQLKKIGANETQVEFYIP